MATAGTWLLYALPPFQSPARTAQAASGRTTDIAKIPAFEDRSPRLELATRRTWLLAAAETSASPIVTGTVAPHVQPEAVPHAPAGVRLTGMEASIAIPGPPPLLARQSDAGEPVRLALQFETGAAAVAAVPTEAREPALATVSALPAPAPGEAALSAEPVLESNPSAALEPAAAPVGALSGATAEATPAAAQGAEIEATELPRSLVRSGTPRAETRKARVARIAAKAKGKPQRIAAVQKTPTAAGNIKPATVAAAAAASAAKTARTASDDPRTIMLMGLGANPSVVASASSP